MDKGSSSAQLQKRYIGLHGCTKPVRLQRRTSRFTGVNRPQHVFVCIAQFGRNKKIVRASWRPVTQRAKGRESSFDIVRDELDTRYRTPEANRETSVDVFVSEPFAFDDEYARALVKPLHDNLPIRFVSLPTLTRMKEEAGGRRTKRTSNSCVPERAAMSMDDRRTEDID